MHAHGDMPLIGWWFVSMPVPIKWTGTSPAIGPIPTSVPTWSNNRQFMQWAITTSKAPAASVILLSMWIHSTEAVCVHENSGYFIPLVWQCLPSSFLLHTLISSPVLITLTCTRTHVKHSCVHTQLLALSLSALTLLSSPANLFLSLLSVYLSSSFLPTPAHIHSLTSSDLLFLPHTSASPLRLPYLILFSLPLAVFFFFFFDIHSLHSSALITLFSPYDHSLSLAAPIDLWLKTVGVDGQAAFRCNLWLLSPPLFFVLLPLNTFHYDHQHISLPHCVGEWN